MVYLDEKRQYIQRLKTVSKTTFKGNSVFFNSYMFSVLYV